MPSPASRWWYAAAAFALALGISFAPGDVALRVGLAVLAAGLGYQLGQRQTQLHEESVTDPLTRLYNRRYFEACLLRELARHERHGGSLALLMVDVDAMKQFNDRGGHDAGDLALCAVADALRNSCRGSDLVARWGGDEFVVLAPHTDEADAERLSQRINTALQQSSVQVSIGVGMAIAADASSQLFARADAALYVVKGRRHVLVLAPS